LLFKWSAARDGKVREHTGICTGVEKDESGNVVAITVVEGNRGGSGTNSWNNSKVKIARYVPNGSYPNNMYVLCSFLSISEYMHKCGIPQGTIAANWMHYFSGDYDSHQYRDDYTAEDNPFTLYMSQITSGTSGLW